MIKGSFDKGYQVVCNKCGRFTPHVIFSKLRELKRHIGWYTLDISPSRTNGTSIDICDTCAKKYTLAQLG